MKPKTMIEFSETALQIVWDDGHESIYLYSELREACPCARCNDLRKGGKPFKLVIPLMGSGIKPRSIEPVGLYAVRFKWSDGHYTGIYSFEFLRKLCTCDNCLSA